jgi:Holliday junction resolvase RusA-like endonuclease
MTLPRSEPVTFRGAPVFLFDDHLAGPRRQVEIMVYGDPAPQGSKSAGLAGLFPSPRSRVSCPLCKAPLSGKFSMRESSKHVKPWRKLVVAQAALAVPLHGPLDGPVVADMVFTLARPADHLGTGRNAGGLRPSAPACHHGRPDLSKLARATEDALVDAGVLRDDSRIWRYGELAKVYAAPPLPLPPADGLAAWTLDRPGVMIRLAES